MGDTRREKNVDRRSLIRMLAITGGAIAVAGIVNTALGTGGGAAGADGGPAGPGGYSNGWCSFWHDEQDPTYGSSALNGDHPQGWDRTSAENQLARLNKMVSLDYTGDPNAGLRAINATEASQGQSNELEAKYYEIAKLAMDAACERATAQRGITVEHARVIGVGIRYMITDWVPNTYGRDGMATATFTELFDKNEMWPATMKSTSKGVAGGLQEASGWGRPSDIYQYTVAQGYATNRDGQWQRALDDMPGDWTLIVVAVAEGEPLSLAHVTLQKGVTL